MGTCPVEFRSSERRVMGWRENYKHLTPNGVKTAAEPLKLTILTIRLLEEIS